MPTACTSPIASTVHRVWAAVLLCEGIRLPLFLINVYLVMFLALLVVRDYHILPTKGRNEAFLSFYRRILMKERTSNPHQLAFNWHSMGALVFPVKLSFNLTGPLGFHRSAFPGNQRTSTIGEAH